MKGTRASLRTIVGRMLLLGVLASWVGPIIAWASWPPSSHSVPTAAFLDNLVIMLWPTRMFALGTSHLEPRGFALLVCSNTLLYLVIETLFMATYLIAGKRKAYVLPLTLAVPVLWQLWGAGFDLKFVEWKSFTISLAYYGGIGLAALSLCTRCKAGSEKHV